MLHKTITPEVEHELLELFEAFGADACKEYLKMSFHAFIMSDDFECMEPHERSNALAWYQYQYDVYVAQKNSIKIKPEEVLA